MYSRRTLFAGEKELTLMKKTLAAILIWILLFSLLPAAEASGADFTLKVPGGNASAFLAEIDDAIALKVDLYLNGVSDSKLLTALSFELGFDPEQLEYVTDSQSLGGSSLYAVNASGQNVGTRTLLINANNSGNGRIGVFFATDYGCRIKDGMPLISFYFRIDREAATGTELTVSIDGDIEAESVKRSDQTGYGTYTRRSVSTDISAYVIDDAMPRITEHPTAARAALGKTATFRVVAVGAAGYQWEYSKNNGTSWVKWSGKTNDSLTVKASETNNGCMYRCIVTFAIGKQVSKAARLTTTNSKPTMLMQPKNVSAALGKEVTFKIAAGGAGLHYQWEYSKNNGESWTVWNGREKASVSVTASNTNNGCLYRCTVSNAYGSVVSEPARLTASNAKPMLLCSPTDAAADMGKCATFTAVAGGTGLQYQWEYSRNNGDSWVKWSGKTNTSITVKGSSTNNGCLYRCRITNSYGSVVSAAARLTVSGAAPMIAEQPENVTVSVGDTAEFRILAVGTELQYRWQYSSDNGKTWVYCKSAGYDKTAFAFTAAGNFNGRQYRCIVENEAGSATSDAALLNIMRSKDLPESFFRSIGIGMKGDMASWRIEKTGIRIPFRSRE